MLEAVLKHPYFPLSQCLLCTSAHISRQANAWEQQLVDPTLCSHSEGEAQTELSQVPFPPWWNALVRSAWEKSPHALCLGTGPGALLQTWVGDRAKSQDATLAAERLLQQLSEAQLRMQPHQSPPLQRRAKPKETIPPGCSKLNPSAVHFPTSMVGQAWAADTSSSSLDSPLDDAGHEQGAVVIGRGSRVRSRRFPSSNIQALHTKNMLASFHSAAHQAIPCCGKPYTDSKPCSVLREVGHGQGGTLGSSFQVAGNKITVCNPKSPPEPEQSWGFTPLHYLLFLCTFLLGTLLEPTNHLEGLDTLRKGAWFVPPNCKYGLSSLFSRTFSSIRTRQLTKGALNRLGRRHWMGADIWRRFSTIKTQVIP